MAWYKDDLETIIDLIKVGNEFIDDCKNERRATNDTFQKISDMMRNSFKDKMPLRIWKVYAPQL